MWRPVADQAIRDYRRDPQPIILIGHSMGGDATLAFAELLNANDIPVNLVVTYDPSRIADDVPPNVERYINIFQSTNVMGGGNVVQGTRFHGHYASYNLKDHNELIHINIEKADRIQEQLVEKIVELAFAWRWLGGQFFDRPATDLAATQGIEDFVLSDAMKPRGRILGDLNAPGLERIQERRLHHVLDQVEVAPAEDTREHRNESRRFVAEKVLHERRNGFRLRGRRGGRQAGSRRCRTVCRRVLGADAGHFFFRTKVDA